MYFLRKSFFKKVSSPLIIAELGLNHNGNLKLAKQSIKAAKIAELI